MLWIWLTGSQKKSATTPFAMTGIKIILSKHLSSLQRPLLKLSIVQMPGSVIAPASPCVEWGYFNVSYVLEVYYTHCMYAVGGMHLPL